MKKCLGKFNYKKEECLNCRERIECMITTFQKTKEENLDIPLRCLGSYSSKEECKKCPSSEECERITSSLQSKFYRKGKHFRITGKYKERGKWKKRDVY